MSAPIVVVRYFNEGAGDRWHRMAKTLAFAIRQHCPGWTLDLAELPAAENMYSPMGDQGHVSNTRKLDAWSRTVDAAPDGAQILLLDADTLVRRPLDVVWDLRFDLGYTVKPEEARYPFNGGVVFLRVSDRTRAFLRMWRDVNQFFLATPAEHQVWSPAFGGINQSALGMLLQSRTDAAWPAPFKGYRHELATKQLSCLEWNCEDEHWERFDPQLTRILHYKSNLQRALFTGREMEPHYKPLLAEWRDMEEASTRAGRWRVTPPPVDQQVRPGDFETPERGQAISTPEGGVAVAPILTRQQRRARHRKGGA